MAQNESKTNGHLCESDTLDATSAARMPGEVKTSPSAREDRFFTQRTRKRGMVKRHPSLPHIILTDSSEKLFVHYSQTVALPTHPTPYCCSSSRMGELLKIYCNSARVDHRQKNSRTKSLLSPDRGTTRPTKNGTSKPLHISSWCKKACKSGLHARCAKEHDLKFSTLCLVDCRVGSFFMRASWTCARPVAAH